MSYVDHFRLVDDILPHMDATVKDALDPFIQSRYVGFFAVSVAAVFELAIKQILIEFATQKHETFGDYCSGSLKKLNGKIQLDELGNNYIKLFGSVYLEKFKENIKNEEEKGFIEKRYSIKAAYSQIITWRHAFAHEGKIPEHATFDEAKNGYLSGKLIIAGLAKAMS